jgi:hypothetical protein
MGEGGKMQLDMNPFPVGMVELGHRKILVRSSQADTTKGKNVIVSDDLRNKMIKPHSPEVGIWKENVGRRSAQRVKPTSDMLIKKIFEAAAGWGLHQAAQEVEITRLPILTGSLNTLGRKWVWIPDSHMAPCGNTMEGSGSGY